uniref:Lig_chan-Glu_bd domain-containing protein n=1 Tax=Meloidogyne hapla TaxID=6305 RepID=A0A1I8BYR5_MELHA
MFPHKELLEAIIDLIRHWHWGRLIIVFTEPERIRRLVIFLEHEAFVSIRFHLIYVEDGDYLKAAKEVKYLEECNDNNKLAQQYGGSNSSPQQHCNEFSRLLLDMSPKDTHYFLLSALKVGLVEHHHWFLTTSLDLRYMNMELFKHNNARFIGLDPTDFSEEDEQKSESLLPLPNRKEFEEFVRSHWIAKNTIISSEGEMKNNEAEINIKMSEAILLFDSIYLLARSLSNETSNILNLNSRRRYFNQRQLQQISSLLFNNNITMARCAGGTRPNNRKFSAGNALNKLLREYSSTTYGLSGSLKSRLNGEQNINNNLFDTNNNFTFQILMLGYTGIIEKIGYWQYGSDIPKIDLRAESRAQQQKRIKVSDELKPHFRVTTILERPYVMLKSKESDNNFEQKQFEGFCIDLLKELANDLGFTYTIHVVRDNKYGSDNGNGSWDGMIGEIIRNEADMAVAPLTYVLSTMLKGGCDFGPRAVSTSAYTANLAAVLTVSRPHIPIRDIDDLANQSDISYGTINGGSTMQFFQESKIAAHAKMWARMKETKAVFVRNNREGVEKVLRERYAFLMESSSLEYEVQQNCNLTQIGGVLGSKGYGIALQKDSEWTDRISRQILLYQKRGVIEMKKTKWWRSKGASCHGVGSSVKQQRISLNLQNVSGLFVILSTGLFLSILIVGIELYVRKKERHQADE